MTREEQRLWLAGHALQGILSAESPDWGNNDMRDDPSGAPGLTASQQNARDALQAADDLLTLIDSTTNKPTP